MHEAPTRSVLFFYSILCILTGKRLVSIKNMNKNCKSELLFTRYLIRFVKSIFGKTQMFPSILDVTPQTSKRKRVEISIGRPDHV